MSRIFGLIRGEGPQHGVGPLGLALAAGLTAPALVAQQEQPAAESLPLTAARYLTRLAQADLRLVGAPKPRDYQIAAELLEVAHRLAPDERVILQLLIEAHENGGNADRVDELTRELIRHDPDDTVAQLRLISTRIRRLQTAEDRLAAYDRYLGKDGEKIDPSVRSRLALDAALLARERGDMDNFARRLSLSTQLDSTNKDAASLALAFYSARLEDAPGRFDLLLNVLNADPLDAEVHRTLAQELAAAGAFRGAHRFYSNYQTLLNRLGREIEGSELTDVLVVDWHFRGPRAVVDQFNKSIFEGRKQVTRDRDQAIKDEKPVDELPTPEMVRLTIENEWVRLLASAGLADPELLVPAMEEFAGTALQMYDAIAAVDRRPADMTEQQATEQLRGILEETVWARLWSGQQIDLVDKGLDQLRADPDFDPRRMSRLDAWRLMRKGEFDRAETALTALAEKDMLAELGLCVLAELRGQKDQAIEAYTKFFRRTSGSLPGAYAATCAERLAGKPLPAAADTRKLEDSAAAVPSWLEAMLADPRRVQSFGAELSTTQAGPLEPVKMRITMRNLSPVAMGVGPDSPLNTRVLISPNVQVGTKPMPTASMLQIASLQHRLRLLPRQEFTTEIWPDSAVLAMLLDQLNASTVRMKYRLLQGFELTDRGVYLPGAYSLSAEAGPLLRPNSPRAFAEPAGLVRWAESGSVRELLEAVVTLRSRLTPDLGMAAPEEADVVKFYAAAAKRFGSLEPAAQLMVLLLAPTASRLPAAAVLDDAARASTDPAVRTVCLALRTNDASDSRLAEAAGPDGSGRLAALVKERLLAQVLCYATATGRSDVPTEPTEPKDATATAPAPDPGKPSTAAPEPKQDK